MRLAAIACFLCGLSVLAADRAAATTPPPLPQPAVPDPALDTLGTLSENAGKVCDAVTLLGVRAAMTAQALQAMTRAQARLARHEKRYPEQKGKRDRGEPLDPVHQALVDDVKAWQEYVQALNDMQFSLLQPCPPPDQLLKTQTAGATKGGMSTKGGALAKGFGQTPPANLLSVPAGSFPVSLATDSSEDCKAGSGLASPVALTPISTNAARGQQQPSAPAAGGEPKLAPSGETPKTAAPGDTSTGAEDARERQRQQDAAYAILHMFGFFDPMEPVPEFPPSLQLQSEPPQTAATGDAKKGTSDDKPFKIGPTLGTLPDWPEIGVKPDGEYPPPSPGASLEPMPAPGSTPTEAPPAGKPAGDKPPESTPEAPKTAHGEPEKPAGYLDSAAPDLERILSGKTEHGDPREQGGTHIPPPPQTTPPETKQTTPSETEETKETILDEIDEVIHIASAAPDSALPAGTVAIFFKPRRPLEDGTLGPSVQGGEFAMLVPTEVRELPSGTRRAGNDSGHDANPVRGTTNKNGDIVLQIAGDQLAAYGIPASAGAASYMATNVTMPHNVAYVMPVTGSGAGAGGIGSARSPSALGTDVRTFQIGSQTFAQVAFRLPAGASQVADSTLADQIPAVLSALGLAAGEVAAVDNCRVEAPGPWIEDMAAATAPEGDGLPEARISLRRHGRER